MTFVEPSSVSGRTIELGFEHTLKKKPSDYSAAVVLLSFVWSSDSIRQLQWFCSAGPEKPSYTRPPGSRQTP